MTKEIAATHGVIMRTAASGVRPVMTESRLLGRFGLTRQVISYRTFSSSRLLVPEYLRVPNNSYECQGRQEHGKFGADTCDDTSQIGPTDGAGDDCPGCQMEDIANAAIGAVPPAERRQYKAWLRAGGLQQLQDAVPHWIEDAKSDPEAFLDRNFGSYGRTDVAKAAQIIAVNLAGARAMPMTKRPCKRLRARWRTS